MIDFYQLARTVYKQETRLHKIT